MRTWLLALTLVVGAASTANAKELQFRQLDTDRYADVLKRNICAPLSERVRRPFQHEVCGGDGTHGPCGENDQACYRQYDACYKQYLADVKIIDDYNAWIEKCNSGRKHDAASPTIPKRDLSQQLQSATDAAKGAEEKNTADKAALNTQQQQAIRSNAVQIEANVHKWCDAHTSNCSGKCQQNARGSVQYMGACNDVCSAVIDACLSDQLGDDNERSKAANRVKTASHRMRSVVNQLNAELSEQRAREEAEAARQIQEFVNVLSSSMSQPNRPAPVRTAPPPATSAPPPRPTYNPPVQSNCYAFDPCDHINRR